jgi:hypothetical protein
MHLTTNKNNNSRRNGNNQLKKKREICNISIKYACAFCISFFFAIS